jgi:hypothetical protein
LVWDEDAKTIQARDVFMREDGYYAWGSLGSRGIDAID